MLIIKGTLLSWLAVTAIFLLTLFIDGMPLSFKGAAGMVALCGLVGFIVAMYLAIFGGAAWFVLLKLRVITRGALLLAGVVASLPMLALSVWSAEPEWIIATLVAAITAGGVYAIQLPSIQDT